MIGCPRCSISEHGRVRAADRRGASDAVHRKASDVPFIKVDFVKVTCNKSSSSCREINHPNVLIMSSSFAINVAHRRVSRTRIATTFSTTATDSTRRCINRLTTIFTCNSSSNNNNTNFFSSIINNRRRISAVPIWELIIAR